ncbi:MAG: DinB family protein [Anaerolineae bacterium]|nr:MAG: DinB family protein [Anaerolineae bacterium]
MTHPLVIQLRFARSEFARGLDGVTEEEATRRFEPMNCISWMVGHLASQENYYWVRAAQEIKLHPEVVEQTGSGRPATTPSLAGMWTAWRDITVAADTYLDTLTTGHLSQHIEFKGRALPESIGTMLYRNIYHYWYHLGEGMAVRQLLGHTDLPEFIGDMSAVGYRPEAE